MGSCGGNIMRGDGVEETPLLCTGEDEEEEDQEEEDAEEEEQGE